MQQQRQVIKNQEPVNIPAQQTSMAHAQPSFHEDEEQKYVDVGAAQDHNNTDYEEPYVNNNYDDSEQSPQKSPDSHNPVSAQNEREPMLYVDVNLGTSGTQRIVVYEGDTAEGLAEKFSLEFNLDESMKDKLTQMLQQQIAGVLEKIDEDEEQISNNSDQNHE